MAGLIAAACHASGAASASAPAARRYRDATKHTPESVRADTFRLDWQNKPTLYRTYAGAETVALPAPHLLTQAALDALVARAPAPAGAFDLDALGTLLFLTGGITRTLPSGRDIRATAAAGALYPNEIYVVAGDLPGLPAGVYHYDPKGAQLARLRRGDWRTVVAEAADDAEVRTAPATIVMTGILWRSAWKYRERAYRHLYWDAGMMLANLLAAANATGMPAGVDAAFVDAQVDRLVGVDGLHEATIALVRIGSGAPPPVALPAADMPALTVQASALSPHPLEYPQALRYHAASQLADRTAVRTLRAARVARPTLRPRGAAQRLAARSDAASLDAVVRRRSSTRRFAQRPISAVDLGTVLALPARAVPVDFLRASGSLIETYIIVHAVTDAAPGAYYYRASDQRLEQLAAGDFRNTAGFLSLNQALARDASVVIYYMADLTRIGSAFGERGYRLAQLEAGLRAGRAYLAAYALGRGASGLTFFDDEVTRFFSPHAAALEPLLVVAVGAPRKR